MAGVGWFGIVGYERWPSDSGPREQCQQNSGQSQRSWRICVSHDHESPNLSTCIAVTNATSLLRRRSGPGAKISAFLYWFLVVATTTAGTTMADVATVR
jgi:hypothetical protein